MLYSVVDTEVQLYGMALNLPTIGPVSGEDETVPRRRYASVPTQAHGPEEVVRLQELLVQALKREADAHKRMKHLYEQLQHTLQVGTNSVSESKLAPLL